MRVCVSGVANAVVFVFVHGFRHCAAGCCVSHVASGTAACLLALSLNCNFAGFVCV